MSSSFQNVPMGDVATFKTGKLDSNAAVENGAYPFFTCSRETFRTNTYSFDDEVVLLAGNNANGIYPLKYFKGKFDAYQRTYVIRPIDESRLDTRFLYFALRPQLDHLRSVSTGSATKFLTMGLLSNLELPLPSLPTQRKIAGILSAYDDLIENNRRRIKILEEMAQSLYREWFVHFRFPGQESVRFVDSALGLIPKGWEVKVLGEIADFRLGKMLDKEKNKGELTPYLANVNVRWGRFELDDLRSMRFKQDELEIYGLRFGDIVMCEGGEPGRCAVWKKEIPGMMIQKALHRIRSRSNMNYPFLYYSLRLLGEGGHLSSFFTGSTIKHLPREKLAKVTMLVPPIATLDKFAKFVEPIECQINALNLSFKNLRQTRDLLLPKLLGGVSQS